MSSKETIIDSETRLKALLDSNSKCPPEESMSICDESSELNSEYDCPILFNFEDYSEHERSLFLYRIATISHKTRTSP